MSRIEKSLVVATIGVAVAMLVVIVPYVVSGFYLHRGTDMLQRAMMEQGLNSGRWSELVGQPIGPLGDRVKSHLDVAEWFLERSIRWDSKNLEAYLSLAKIYQIRRDDPSSLEVLAPASEVRRDNPMVHLALGDIYDGLGWAEKAIAEYEQGGYGPSIERAIANYLKLADWHLKADDPDSALPLLQQVITLDAGNLYALYHFAKICDTLGEGERLLAEEIYQRIQYFPLESIRPRQDARLDEFTAEVIPRLVEDSIWSLADALNVISFWIWQEGYEQAELAIEPLLETFNNELDLYYYLGQVHQRLGEYQEAIDICNKAIELDPEYAPAYLEMGRTYESETPKDLEEAVGWYERYHELAPEDLLGLKKLAEVYEELGEEEKARKWRERLATDCAKSYPLVFQAEDMPRLTGKVVNDSEASSGLAAQSEEKADFLAYGPYESLPPGSYRVHFRLKIEDNSSSDEVALLDIQDYSAAGSDLLPSQVVRGTDFEAAGQYEEVVLEFYEPLHSEEERLEFRVFFYGGATLWLDNIQVYRAECRN